MRLLVGYVGAFLLEDRLFAVLRTARGRSLFARSRLCSAEFVLLHYPLLAWVLLRWLPRALASARAHCLADRACSHRLTPGAGSIDLSDAQWRAYRGALPLLLITAVGTVAAGAGAARLFGRRHRHRVDLAIGACFLFYVHGGGALWHLLLAAAFHFAASSHASMWLLALSALVIKEPPIARHLRLAPLLGRPGAMIDGWRGAYGWHASINLLVLRLLSYAADRRAAAARGEPDRHRRYTLSRCVAHALYAPLFLAGPIITYDAYATARDPRADGADERADGAGPRADGRALRVREGADDEGGGLLALAVDGVRLAAAYVMLEGALRAYPLFALPASGLLGRLPPTPG